MFTVTITEKNGKKTVREFDQPEVTIGRVMGNDVVLPKANISKRHARILCGDQGFVVVDAKSTNGTFINGRRIAEPHDLDSGDKIFIGEFALEVVAAGERSGTAPPPPPARGAAEHRATDEDEESAGTGKAVLDDDAWGGNDGLAADWSEDWDDASQNRSPSPAADPAPARGGTPVPTAILAPNPASVRPEITTAPRGLAPKPAAAVEPTAAQVPARALVPMPLVAADPMTRAAHVLHHRLWPLLIPELAAVASLHDEGLRRRTSELTEKVARELRKEGQIDSQVDLNVLVSMVRAEAVGLGPLESLWADVEVTEVLVTHPRQVLVERRGQLESSDKRFSCDAAVTHLVHRLLHAAGKPLAPDQAVVETRLPDGLSVAAVLPPLAVRGPTLTLRRVAPEPLQVDDLVAAGTLTAPMAELLETAVQSGMNIGVSGSRGAGKTTTLNVLAGYIPIDARIVTVEERAELSLEHDQVVSLEARSRAADTSGVNSVRDLLAVAQRLHPSRLILGECRGPEAAELLKAMAGGTDGVMTSVQAADATDALARLETMLLWDGADLPPRITRQVVSQAVNLVVEQARLVDGTRRITRITEVTGVGRSGINLQDIFVFEQSGIDDDGKVTGRHKATGTVPSFYERLRQHGASVDTSIFESA
ncbi:MAG: ATPase, T2SS/T4P/T4SS family [Myxococcota bacterium]